MKNWIKVEDELPEYLKSVLVVIGSGDLRIGEPRIACRIKTHCGGWTWHFDGSASGEVFMWQPLPELPNNN